MDTLRTIRGQKLAEITCGPVSAEALLRRILPALKLAEEACNDGELPMTGKTFADVRREVEEYLAKAETIDSGDEFDERV